MIIRPIKEVLGFKNGYITIFKGDIEAVEEWFKAEPKCRFHTIWGWYIASEEEIPNLPTEVSAVRLDWDLVGNLDGSFKPESAIINAIDTLLYEPSSSKHIGSVGERLELKLTVIKVIKLDDHYGSKTFHVFTTPEGDIATWATTVKSYEVGEEHILRGTVLAHDIYKGEAQTRLTRCIEVKSK